MNDGGRKRIDFANVGEISASDAHTARGDSAIQDGLTLKVTVENHSTNWNFGTYSRPDLALEVMRVVQNWIQNGKSFDSFTTFLNYRLKIGGFIRKINNWDPKGIIQSLTDIDRAFLDIFDGPNLTNSQYDRLTKIVVFLREARRQDSLSVSPELLSSELGDRLRYVSRWPKPIPTPKDAYSPYIVKQIQDAARSEIKKTIAEIREGIAGLMAVQQATGDHELTPVGAALRDVAAGTPYNEAIQRYKEELRRAGHIHEAPKEQVDLSNFDQAALQQAARDIAREGTVSGSAFTERDLKKLKTFCPEFLEMISLERTNFLEEVRRRVLENREAENKLLQHSTPSDVGIADVISELATEQQLQRRLHVLSSWRESGIPRSKVGSVKFDLIDVGRWDDPEYGIKAVDVLARGSRGVKKQYTHLAANISAVVEDLAQRYLRRPERHHYDRLLRKVELLEHWVLVDCPPELANVTLNRDFLIKWENPDQGLEMLSSIRTVPSYPRYGPIVEWAYTLLRALTIQLEARGLRNGMSAKELRQPPLTEIAASICPTQDELTSFLAHLGLMCQIDLGSMKLLERDCLQNSANGFVDIFYRKNRNDRHRHSERVRDGSLETPGGLIKVVLELTEPAHRALLNAQHPDAKYLWLGAFQGSGYKKCTFQHPVMHPWWRFCERNIILDDNGERMDTVHPSCFRKTVKAGKYRKSGGDVFAIADDHSYAVSRDHYADLPSLAEVHDDAVTRGLENALADIAVRVISEEHPGLEQAKRLSDATGIPVTKCREVLDGREDVWLSSCLAFKKSPFGAEGEDCPTPFIECIHCPNSVFTSRKLPNLLRCCDILRERRSYVDDKTWRAKYFPDLYRIEFQILPRFTDQQIETARQSIQKKSDTDPLFLPPSIGTSL